MRMVIIIGLCSSMAFSVIFMILADGFDGKFSIFLEKVAKFFLLCLGIFTGLFFTYIAYEITKSSL